MRATIALASHARRRREDTMVLLAAGGRHKVRLIRQVLEAGLCNALITDADTAVRVLDLPESVAMRHEETDLVETEADRRDADDEEE
jgi:hypothetical protein